jgi:hypothetical protein
MSNKTIFEQLYKLFHIEKGLTNHQIAKRFGISTRTLRRWNAGKFPKRNTRGVRKTKNLERRHRKTIKKTKSSKPKRTFPTKKIRAKYPVYAVVLLWFVRPKENYEMVRDGNLYFDVTEKLIGLSKRNLQQLQKKLKIKYPDIAKFKFIRFIKRSELDEYFGRSYG